MSNYIILDGTEYPVSIATMDRQAEVLDKYFYRVESGSAVREVIGTFYNYTLSIGIEDDVTLYNALFDKLAEPVASHQITLPHDHLEWEGYISTVRDSVRRIDSDGTCYFKSLTCDLIATNPTRYAE